LILGLPGDSGTADSVKKHLMRATLSLFPRTCERLREIARAGEEHERRRTVKSRARESGRARRERARKTCEVQKRVPRLRGSENAPRRRPGALYQEVGIHEPEAW
jgi:hypothetical protein